MNANPAEQINQLKDSIRRKEAELTELEAAVLDLQRELEAFQQRYDRVVKPVEVRLDAARAAVRDLEDEQRYGADMSALGDANPMPSYWQPDANYVPVEEQFRQAWRRPDPVAPPDAPTTATAKPRAEAADSREARLKKIYRGLARRYHPDLAADPTERAQRTDLMQRINAAYTQRDLATLEVLARQPEGHTPAVPLAELQLKELAQIEDQLTNRLMELRLTRMNLLHGERMRLAMEEKIARRQGRDLLRDIAADLERDYQAAMLRLEQLRQRRR